MVSATLKQYLRNIFYFFLKTEKRLFPDNNHKNLADGSKSYSKRPHEAADNSCFHHPTSFSLVWKENGFFFHDNITKMCFPSGSNQNPDIQT